MKLICLGSSSKGNCYILESDSEALVIEVGIPLKEVKKALDFNISKVVGALASHQHKDHSKYISDYMKSGIEVYTSEEALSALKILPCEYSKAIVPNQSYKIGGFTIQPFELKHDVPCLGFYIKHDDIGKLLFITDTEYVHQNFRNLNVNHILVEANHSREYLDADIIRSRVMQSHMELQTTLDFIKNNDSSNLKNVILLHLSDRNSNEEQFLKKAKESVQSANVYVADKGLEVDLNLIPFG